MSSFRVHSAMDQPQEGNSDEETFFDLDETFFNDEVFAAIDQQVEEYHATQQAQLHSQPPTAIAQQQTLSMSQNSIPIKYLLFLLDKKVKWMRYIVKEAIDSIFFQRDI